jgi:hypothetical protein
VRSGPPSPFLRFWYDALATPLGIYIRVAPQADPSKLKSLLYFARAKAKDPDIAHLQIRTSPYSPKDEILIFNPTALGS